MYLYENQSIKFNAGNDSTYCLIDEFYIVTIITKIKCLQRPNEILHNGNSSEKSIISIILAFILFSVNRFGTRGP